MALSGVEVPRLLRAGRDAVVSVRLYSAQAQQVQVDCYGIRSNPRYIFGAVYHEILLRDIGNGGRQFGRGEIAAYFTF